MKLRALAIAVIAALILPVCPVFPVSAAGTTTMALLPENFTLPEDYGTADNPTRDGWMPYNTAGDAGNTLSGTGLGEAGGIYEHFLRSKKGAWYAAKPATAEIYLEDLSKPYYIWVLTFNSTTKPADMSRLNAGFNGKYDDRTFANTTADFQESTIWNDAAGFKADVVKGFGWKRSVSEYTFTEHLNTVNVKIPNTTSGANVVIVTNDANLTFDSKTTWDDIKAFTDIEKPKWSGGMAASYINPTTVSLELPAVEEANLQSLSYSVNGEVLETEGGTVQLDNLTPLKSLIVKAEAKDSFGNVSVLEESLSVSPVGVTDGSFVFCDENGNTVTEIGGLASVASVGAKLNAKSRTGQAINAVIGVGIYDKALERMISFGWSDASIGTEAGDASGGQLTIPDEVKDAPQNYALRAFLWEREEGSTDYSEPLTPGITLKEVE